MRTWILIAVLALAGCRKPAPRDPDEDEEGDESVESEYDAGPPVRRAEPPALPVSTTDPEAAYELGERAYDTGDFVTAVGYLKTAYQLRADPVFLYDIAQALRQLDDCYNAVAYYRRYIAAAPDAKDATKLLTALLSRCRDA